MANITVGRKSGFIRRSEGMRRQTRWLELPTVESTLGGAPTAVLALVLTTAEKALRPFTIVRTRGIIHIRSDQAAASETYGADLGIAVVTDQAVAVGITAVPTPLTDKGSDAWFVYEQLFSHLSVRSDIGQLKEGAFTTFDSKAMRKVDDGFDVAVVQENEIAGVVMTISGRMLVKLH